MEIKIIDRYDECIILPLYASVGWTAYTDTSDALKKGFENSLLALGAYENGRLVGLIRVVGDGHTVILIQDILVFPEYQRQGVGTKLVRAVLERFSHVRQVLLTTDNTPKTIAFYRSIGLREYSEIGCCGFMRI